MKTTNVGVIVGRFQTPRLTPGHVHLINTALLQNDEVILFIGSSPLRNARKQPIPFVWRSSMVQADPRIFRAGKNFHIVELPDCGNDAQWSNNLHVAIEERLSGQRLYRIGTVRLYGSRDSSFLQGFDIEGVETPYEKVELLPFSNFSATELREQVSKRFPSGSESDDLIREGMIIASQMRYPMVVSTVDVAILEAQDGEVGVWLGRKPTGINFRFIGGFAEPTSKTDEEDAIREAQEETGFIVNNPEYIGNTLIDDWRFRGDVDKIRTRFFVTTVESGVGQGADDIAEIKWFPLGELKGNKIVSEHGTLLDMFIKWTLTEEGIKYVRNVQRKSMKSIDAA